MKLLPFQQRFVKSAFRPGIRTAALSLPRGNGKSTLAARLAFHFLRAGSGREAHLVAASVGQARRAVFKQLRAMVGADPAYRIADAPNAAHVIHRATKTKISVIAGDNRTAQGLVGVPLLICDEPGAWHENGGAAMWDAIETAHGKPGSPMKVILIGTLAPAKSGWWHELVQGGSGGDVFVSALQGRLDRWSELRELRRVNPLIARHPVEWSRLVRERDAARGDPRLKASFLSYRLNLPTADESEVLLRVEDWKAAVARSPADRKGRPIVGVDLGAGRAWSAAVAVWSTGLIEALAVGPGIPDIGDQERRDQVPAGSYRRLIDGGALSLAEGLRVPPVSGLIDRISSAWGTPERLVCDRFRLGELQDCCSWRLEPRVSRWSEAAADIRALRRGVLDGGWSVSPASANLIAASLAAAMVKNDDGGNVRLEKKGSHNTGRDDVAAALVLAAGGFERSQRISRPRSRYVGLAG